MDSKVPTSPLSAHTAGLLESVSAWASVDTLTAAVVNDLQAAGCTDLAAVTRVLLIGNSGRGKSYLANLLIGRERFVHLTVTKSVTADVEYAVMQQQPSNGEWLVVFNVPGLIEPQEENWPRNQRAVELAVRCMPGVRTVVVLVACVGGGRLNDEDFVAFTIFLRFVALLSPMAVSLVFNAVDSEEFETQQEASQWQQRIIEAAVTKLDGRVRGNHVCFVPLLPKATRKDFDHPDSVGAANLLRSVVDELLPYAAAVEPAPGATLLMDKQLIAAESLKLVDKTNEERLQMEVEEGQVSEQGRAEVERVEREMRAREATAAAQLSAARLQAKAGNATDQATYTHEHSTDPRRVNAAAPSLNTSTRSVIRPDASTVITSPRHSAATQHMTAPHAVSIRQPHARQPFDFSTVDAKLLRLRPRKVTAVLIMGNTGRGKSFLADVFLGTAAFVHTTSGSSQPVTAVATAQLHRASSSESAIVVYDLRGLISTDGGEAEENRVALLAALHHLQPDSPICREAGIHEAHALLIGVTCTRGGRLLEDDVLAFNIVLHYVQSQLLAADHPRIKFLIVMNFVEWDEFVSPVEKTRFKTDVQAVLRSLVPSAELVVWFLGQVPKAAREILDPMRPDVHRELADMELIFCEMFNDCPITLLPATFVHQGGQQSERALQFHRRSVSADLDHVLRALQDSQREQRQSAAMQSEARRNELLQQHQRMANELAQCRRELRRMRRQQPQTIIIEYRERRRPKNLWNLFGLL